MRYNGGIRASFMFHAVQIWGDFVKRVEVEVRFVPGQKAPARLVMPHNPRIIGDHIVTIPRKITLEVSEAIHTMPEDKFEAVMRHEALHMGIMNHGQEFHRMAKLHKVKVSLMDIAGEKVHLQVKEGARYKTIKVFDTEKEAVKWFKEVYLPAHPGAKARTSF